MSYAVHSLFYSLQGEGARSGRAAVFIRFAGCNLWSGREADRAQAVCRFCDTDFASTGAPGGGRYPGAEALAAAVAALWPGGGRPYVVCTGGEPALQLDAALVTALHAVGFEVAIETNGTLPLVDGIDWRCVSPKAGAELVVRAGEELKLVFPQQGVDPGRYLGLAFRHFYLQPRDECGTGGVHPAAALDYCLRDPRWTFGLQLHKVVGIE